MSIIWTEESIAKDFAWSVVEKYYDDLPCVGEWEEREGRCVELFTASDACDDFEEHKDWTYTYKFSSVPECGNDRCNRFDCRFVPVGEITIDIGGGVKYKYTSDRDGCLEAS